MKKYKFYKPVNRETVAIPCYVETAYESMGQYVSFQKLLNDNYGSYRKAVIHVPAEFNPELVGEWDCYLSLAYYAEDARYYLAEPAIRVGYVPSKGFALVTITKETYSNRSGSRFEKMYLNCRIVVEEDEA